MPHLTPHTSKRVGVPIIVLIIVAILALLGIGIWGAIQAIAHTNASSDNQQFIADQHIATIDASANNFDEAANVWLLYAKTSPSRAHRSAAYLFAADDYMTNNQFEKALQSAQLSEAVSGITYPEAEVAGAAAASLGQYGTAIKYYQAVIRLMPQTISDRDSNIAMYQQAITTMQQSRQ